ncbi:MAG: hypothetical protein HXX17_10145 [Geobacteraceae bacterium]|nr:hypothetical protein [Geobacteraceae bacterium]
MDLFKRIKFYFNDINGTNALDASIVKFRELRDSYRQTNREYYGEYLFSILEQK